MTWLESRVIVRSYVVAAVFGVTMLCLGCQSPDSHIQLDIGDVDLQKSDVPFLLISRIGVSDSEKAGVIAAVWYDGTVIRSLSQQRVTPRLERGGLNNDHMGVLIKRVRMAFDMMPETGILGHAVSAVMEVRMKSGTKLMATREVDWQEHPIADIKRLIFSIRLRNVTEIDAKPYYSEKPDAWRKVLYPKSKE